MPLLLSVLIIILSSAPLYFLTYDSRWYIYPLSTLQGIGMAIMINTATSLISDVIGNDSKNSAFVYGCYSLFEKFANGGLLYWILAKYTEDDTPEEIANSAYALRIIMSACPIICAISAYFLTYLGNYFFSHKLSKITGVK